MPAINIKTVLGAISMMLTLAVCNSTCQNLPASMSDAAACAADLAHCKKSAGYGDPAAQTRLGYLYATGSVLPHDDAAALRMFMLAASSEAPSASSTSASCICKAAP
jgi:TPR repeat protein